ncbi:hypothetical protein AAHA92_12530 [Salvia divinorum]|uniref:Uncharacterized protein n=1 Tax=Salvia divinorum TaxID=28513 RepID=A0ABD1HLU4_SALDI
MLTVILFNFQCLIIGWFLINLPWKPVLVELVVGYLGLAVGYAPIFDVGVDRVYEGWQKEFIIFGFFSFQEKAVLGFYIVTGSIIKYLFTTSYILPGSSRP